MKAIICASIAISSFIFQGVALASSNELMDSLEFQYMVCSYLEDGQSVDNVLSDIDTEIEIADVSLSDSQEDILDDLYEGNLVVETYCADLEY